MVELIAGLRAEVIRANLERVRAEIVAASERAQARSPAGEPREVQVLAAIKYVASADLPLLAGDRYVFCTDGVTRLVFEREMRDIVGRPGDAETIVRNLVELALQRGGPDNATVAAVIIDAL